MSAAPALGLAPPPPPRYSRERDPRMATDGAKVGVIARALGTPLLPWQQLVADVATEYAPTDVAGKNDPRVPEGRPRRWRYRTVVVTVPRQCGKSVLTRVVQVQRAIMSARHHVFMTAQMGKDAAERWADLAEAVESSAMLSRLAHRPRRSVGSQSVRFLNQSWIRPFAPGPKAVHGYSPHMVSIDEAWAFDAAEGEALLAAIRPAMQTRTDRQLWIVSTAGDARSAFLRELVDRGRAGTDPELAYFEWSADPDADPYDPETWAFHPGLGHLITLEDLAGEAAAMRGSAHGAFVRGYLNVSTLSRETVMPLDRWDALATEQTPPPPSALTLAYDVDHDRRAASIWAAWREGDTTHTRCVMYRHGWTWLAPTVAQLREDWRPAAIGADDAGAARQVTDDLRNTYGLEVETLTARDFATATGAVLASTDHDAAGNLAHDGSPIARHAIENAATRRMGQAIAWDRNASLTGISPVIALTVAARLAEHGAPPAPAPQIVA